jgi:hypothetical protein
VLVQKPKSVWARRRLRLAASARTAIRHPNVAPARRHAKRDGRGGVIVESRPQPLLGDVPLPLDFTEAALIVCGACRGIEAMAGAGLVPSDLTPQHIYVDFQVGGVVADTGLPVEIVPRPPTDRDPYLAYRSPEELDGRARDARSTVYSLGAILFTALTGRPPFAGAWSNVYVGHTAASRPSARSHGHDIPDVADRIVTRALQVDPADRYANAAALGAALALAAELPAWEPADAAPPTANGNAPDFEVAAIEEADFEVAALEVPDFEVAHTEIAETEAAPAPAEAAPADEPRASAAVVDLKVALVRPAVEAGLKLRAISARAIHSSSRPRRARGPRGVRRHELVRRVRRGVARKPAAEPSPARRLDDAIARVRRRIGERSRTAAAIAATLSVAGAAIIVLAIVVVGGNAPASQEQQASPRGQRAAPPPAEPRAPVSAQDAVLEDLMDARVLARRRLARAATAEGQAAAARSLEVLFRDAARRLSGGDAPAGQPQLVTALIATGTAYSRLAEAIGAEDQLAYDEARAAVVSRESAVLRAASLRI